MLRLRFVSICFLSFFCSSVYSQAAYMDEAYEDAVDSGSDGATGIISMLVLLGIIWIISKVYDSYKDDNKRNERIKHNKEISSKVATETLQKHTDISKYQYKESWKKGFTQATYDIFYGRVKVQSGTTLNNLVQEYRNLCERGHMVQAESVMERIGYLQKLEFNQQQIEAERKAKEQKNSSNQVTSNNNVSPPQKNEEKNIETSEYTLSPDGKVFIKAKDVEIVHIPYGVEVIQRNAFDNLKQLKEAILPNTVKEIGFSAFSFSSVEKIVIPSSIEKIGENCFYFCTKLKYVKIQHGIRKLAMGMFSNCDSLNEISLPSTITAIPDFCFQGCISLQNISLPNNLQYIGDDAFLCCESLSKITIPESVTYIGLEAFRQCYELKSIIIPHKVVGLSEYMFYDDYKLKKVVLPSNLTCIMSRVFGNCTPLNIKLPLSVSHIEKDAFSQCYKLKLYVPKGKKELYENNLDDVNNHILEYDYSNEYIQSEEIKERTNSFLSIHKEKKRIRSKEMLNL